MATDREIAELTRLAGELVERIDSLIGGTGQYMVGMAKSNKRNRNLLVIAWIVLSLNIAVTIAVIVSFLALRDVTDTVNNKQEIARVEALCPLYEVFIRADTPAARERARESGVDLKERDRAFADIRHGYKALRCDEK